MEIPFLVRQLLHIETVPIPPNKNNFLLQIHDHNPVTPYSTILLSMHMVSYTWTFTYMYWCICYFRGQILLNKHVNKWSNPLQYNLSVINWWMPGSAHMLWNMVILCFDNDLSCIQHPVDTWHSDKYFNSIFFRRQTFSFNELDTKMGSDNSATLSRGCCAYMVCCCTGNYCMCVVYYWPVQKHHPYTAMYGNAEREH